MKKMRLLPSAVLAANLLLCAVFLSNCKQKDWYEHKVTVRDTVLVYFNDTLPKKEKYSEVYSNFTETRNVSFQTSRNWEDKTISVAWFLWIDGEIAYSNPEIWTKVKPENLEKYKAKQMRLCNEKIPSLLKVWSSK